jgi:uncharacterized membrane protein HdeD (DUF308 family)
MFTGKWWALVLRGFAAILFGLLALFLPGITLGVLITLFAAYALFDGIFAIAAAINRSGGSWGAMLLRGILGIIASIIAITYPATTAIALFFLIAAWAIVTGLVEIFAAASLRKATSGEWKLVLSGVVSVVFGVLLMAYPGHGLLALIWLLGVFGIVLGASLVAAGFGLRNRVERLDSEFWRRAA